MHDVLHETWMIAVFLQRIPFALVFLLDKDGLGALSVIKIIRISGYSPSRIFI